MRHVRATGTQVPEPAAFWWCLLCCCGDTLLPYDDGAGYTQYGLIERQVLLSSSGTGARPWFALRALAVVVFVGAQPEPQFALSRLQPPITLCVRGVTSGPSELKRAEEWKKSVPNDASPKDSGSEKGSSSDEPSQNSDSSESSALQK